MNFYNNQMKNLKCSEKLIKKKKPSKIPVSDQRLNNNQQSINELISQTYNNQTNHNIQQIHSLLQQTKSNLSQITINKAKSSQQKFNNYKQLIQQYEKYKVKRQVGNQLIEKDKSNLTAEKQILKKQNLFNDKNLYKSNNIKMYSSMENLLQNSRIDKASPKNIKLKQYEKNQGQQNINYFVKNQTLLYKNQKNNQQQRKMKDTKKKQQQSSMKKSNNNYFSKKSNIDIKQLQHKYMLLSENYNKSLKQSKQTITLFQRQKQHLLKIKTEHFQNQQLIDHLMNKVRNRNYLNLEKNIEDQQTYVFSKKIYQLVDGTVQTQDHLNKKSVSNLKPNYCINDQMIKIVSSNSNNEQQIYQYSSEQMELKYEDMKSNVQTYKNLQSQENTVQVDFNSEQNQNDSNSIHQLKRDLFNVKNMMLNEKNIIAEKDKKQIFIKQSFQIPTSQFLKMDSQVKKMNKYRFQPSISISTK